MRAKETVQMVELLFCRYLVGFFAKKPTKIAPPKNPIQSYGLPGAKIYIRKCTIIK